MPCPVKGSKKSAASPTRSAPAELTRPDRAAKGPVTDEAGAVEQLGLRPRLVAGSRENLKVTWPEDLAIAESILKRRA